MPGSGKEQCREAVTLWRLQPGGLHCFVVEWPNAFWLGVECGAELTISETLPDIGAVLQRANAVKSTLLGQGWVEDEDDRPATGSRLPDWSRGERHTDEI